MQTILLCEFYARFRGRKVVTRPSQQFRSIYSRVSFLSFPIMLFDTCWNIFLFFLKCSLLPLFLSGFSLSSLYF